MALPTSAHAAVKAQTKNLRNSAARARRGAMPGKALTVTLLEATAPDGTRVLVAVTPGDPDRGYILRQNDAGEWACGCFNRKWMGHCAHEAAANQREAA